MAASSSVSSESAPSFGKTVQAFVIHRHGARYPLKQPNHNILWPSEKSFWSSHVGRLTPVGVLQMSQLGEFFRFRYDWVDIATVKVYSTHRSRALESAWSLLLGLLPEKPIKFNPIHTSNCVCSCDELDIRSEVSEETEQLRTDGGGICYISYHKKDDPLFGREDPSLAYKININDSTMLKEYQDRDDVTGLIERLSKNGHFRMRRDAITTVAKLKEIYSQILIDEQLRIPYSETLAAHYGLTESELELINTIGCEVMRRRLIPSTDSIADDLYNIDQGQGLVRNIYDKLVSWDGTNELNIYSCHDTNMIAVMSVFGIKIIPPSFSGYILIERVMHIHEPVKERREDIGPCQVMEKRDDIGPCQIETTCDDIGYGPVEERIDDTGYGQVEERIDDYVAVYYCPYPFVVPNEIEAKVWSDVKARKDYLEWDDLETGSFGTRDFITTLKASLS